MSWSGYFEYAGMELINVARTEAYAQSSSWFRPTFDAAYLNTMLGDPKYRSAAIDEAPWIDPDRPESADFWGIYPLDITGIDDSTATSTVTESVVDGGVPGRVRRTTRSIVFSVALLGANEAAVDYGTRWLRALLNGSACGGLATESCNGDNLCYLSSDPSYNDYDANSNPVLCLDDYLRTLRRVVFNSGPVITAKREASDGGVVWTATLTAVAGNPYEFGQEVPVVTGFMDPAIPDPYAPDLTGVIDLNGFLFQALETQPEVYRPVVDPLCPALVIPPGPPSISLGCYIEPANWRRRQFTIPEQLIPLWMEVVPKIEVHALTGDVRNLRLRFYADVDGNGSVGEDPNAYCGDILISYVPYNSTLVFDGSDQVIYVQYPGGLKRRADNLVFRTDGTPFEWPSLSCGFQYVVTVDMPQTQEPPTMDFSVFTRVA